MARSLPSCVAVVGLGYVGFSLTSAFGRVIPTVGFDVDRDRIRELREGHGPNGATPPEALKGPYLSFTHDPAALQQADFFIVAVPTPVDRAKRPDLSHLTEASRTVGQVLKLKALNGPGRSNGGNKPIVVYESTVYPGCTEEVCIPILERESGLKVGQDFQVGYSPERINPGDPEHTLETVVKVVAGQDAETTETMAKVYNLAVKAGVYKAPDIRTAEAAKVIENVQRDLNIALMNELSMLFHRLGMDTHEVLKAARTKWNFLPFEPGLVGGHCIPVDPYYLTHKAQEMGYYPEVILAGRRINDQMGVYVAQETVKSLIRVGKAVRGARVLVLGVAFKENVRDVRNSRVVDLVRELESYGIEVSLYDPVADIGELQRWGIRTIGDPFETDGRYDAVILAVSHQVFRQKEPEAYLRLLRTDGARVLMDVKGVLPLTEKKHKGNPGVLYWSL
ncbi:MAG: nucleotide sugar dehydrogenase [Candidatus Methylomirabilales bacterium]